MATDMNNVFLIGRLTRDSELKYTNGGAAILKFAIANSRSVKRGDKREEETSFFDCTMFGKSAESMSKYLAKGKQVAVSGELRQSRWEQDGQTRSRVEVSVRSLQLLGGKSDAPVAPADIPEDGSIPF